MNKPNLSPRLPEVSCPQIENPPAKQRGRVQLPAPLSLSLTDTASPAVRKKNMFTVKAALSLNISVREATAR